MNIPVTSDITVLDHLLALNLNISLWSARRKLVLEDFGNVELPPEDIASLGSKRVCDPARLCIFNTLKARAVSLLDRHGIRVLGGWGIPADKAGAIITELGVIRDEFNLEKEKFLTGYDQAISDWLAKHPRWANILAGSTVSGDYVRARMNFSWQLYRVTPPVELGDEGTMRECGLHEEVEGIAKTLFGEIAKDAEDIWKKVYSGKNSVTHKALSPLRVLQQKLTGLTFVEPHVAPVADLVDTALARTPRRGNIVGADLLMLQGLVCLLREPDALVEHAHKLLEGYGATNVLDGILQETCPVETGDTLQVEAEYEDEMPYPQVSPCPVFSPPTDGSGSDIPPFGNPLAFPDSLGLW